MKKNILLLVIFLICLISFITLYFVLNYMDPYINPVLAVGFLVASVIFSISSFTSLILYFIKKIHYRGHVYISHIVSSFRQGFFLSIFLLGLLFFKIISAPILTSSFLLFISLLLIELFIQNLNIEE